ncbi:hypothetical protein TSAR_003069 [Trichomalopsis sarcophagae]|uniref:Uncharacterized protein n=1 Tax=Trichomalopsis sarcophagae TaxID=543379 RepID=A0A232FLI7_9HYME|nr:hypothetical protein TSAR_003069 [Trichomalopsis sarcophagae]
MIIEDRGPLSSSSRRASQSRRLILRRQDSCQRFLDQLLLLKHRTAKFSSNRHRKLQPFRET